MNKKEAVDILLLSFLLLFIFVLIYAFWLGVLGEIWGREFHGSAEYPADELENTTITFDIDRLITGEYVLQSSLVPHSDITDIQQVQELINFEFTVHIQQGNRTNEKIFIKTFKQGNSQSDFNLFNVPFDFLWSRKAGMEIIIKDIKFDKEFDEYFQGVFFRIVHLQLLGGH